MQSTLKIHSFGPYGNVKDKLICQYIGVPLIKIHTCAYPTLWGDGNMSKGDTVSESPLPHQESWSPVVDESGNKNSVIFDRNMGFVSCNTEYIKAPARSPVEVTDTEAYLKVASAVRHSGVPNYQSVRIPISSSFNLKYVQDHIEHYHDKALLDYLTFGFPLNLNRNCDIKANATENHSSARNFSRDVYKFIQSEVMLGSLAGPFHQIPHEQFTWSPLMTRPKDTGRRVILDLLYGDSSVNKATYTEHYDQIPFKLVLPHLDALIPQLEALGDNARLFKVDISRAFRNVRIDPGDALHLGIKWDNKFYMDRNLAFGAVHGTAIFQRITDFIRFLMARKGFRIYNYIDDMYACCHVDQAEEAFHTLLEIINNFGLPVNESKVFPPTKRLSIMGIVVDVQQRTFSIPDEKLREIYDLCKVTLLKLEMSKRDLQSLLGKLLYIARCVRGARVFLNRMLQTLRQANTNHIIPDPGFYQDLMWFERFLHSFNGVVRFKHDPVSIHAYVDATLTHLGGAWGNRVYSVPIPMALRGHYSITQYEMFNITVALKLWGNNWKDKTVCIHCDNLGAVTVCGSSKTKDPFLNWCLHSLWLNAARHNIQLRVIHIPGRDNVIADSLSRNVFQGTDDTCWENIPDRALDLSL